ncbi:hypothetical protein Gocc_1020 [Gaiella occulta]|uniref:Uncharacterized protein n=1 Tax=Gaiella occulta TaxID=1002870 RepID=A0A7M2Z0K8_9ACTN|nr:hypothetical protein [Gaiella occulta]RDI75222.1 hypothetical protein Gocc_1020 [Gaiella occulta]
MPGAWRRPSRGSPTSTVAEHREQHRQAFGELAEQIDETLAAAAGDPALAERIDALEDRLDEVAAQAAVADVIEERPRAAARAGDDTEKELERLRMAIERVSLHLGEHERAIAGVRRSRGVAQRLDELAARVDGLVAGEPAGAAGGTDPSRARLEALARRLEAAEAVRAAEHEKLLTKLERMASSIDRRLHRLETGGDA